MNNEASGYDAYRPMWWGVHSGDDWETPTYETCERLFSCKNDKQLAEFRRDVLGMFPDGQKADTESLLCMREAMQAAMRIKNALDAVEDLTWDAMKKLGFHVDEVKGSFEPHFTVDVGSGPYHAYIEKLLEVRPPFKGLGSHYSSIDGGYSGYVEYELCENAITFGFTRYADIRSLDSRCQHIASATLKNLVAVHLACTGFELDRHFMPVPAPDCAASAMWYALAAQMATHEVGVCAYEKCNKAFIRKKPRNPKNARKYCCDAHKHASYVMHREEKQKGADNGELQGR